MLTVFRYPFVSECEVGYLFQALHIADDHILLALLFRLEIKFKGTNQLAIDFRQWQIFLVAFQFDKFRQIAFAAFITAVGNQSIVLAYKFTTLVVMLLHGLDERAEFLHFFVSSEKFLLQDSGCDRMVSLLQFIEQLAQLDFGLLDVEVEFTSLAALAFGTLLRLIP